MLVNAHYRQGLNFAFSALDDARKSLERIDRCVDALQSKAINGLNGFNDGKDLNGTSGLNGLNIPNGEMPEFAAKALEGFTAAVNDDLNTPKAFAALFELVRETNGALPSMSPAQAAAVLAVFQRMDTVLGVIFFGKAAAAEIPAEIQTLLDKRAEARKARDWAESDRLRDEIAAAGWIVKDSRDGQTVTRK